MRRRALLAASQTESGFGEPFSFYIADRIINPDYIEYTALEGMTWKDWIYSKYNIDNFTFSESWDRTFVTNIDGFIVSYGSSSVALTDIIIANKKYDLEP